MSSHAVVTRVLKREPTIEYRPHTHHKLHLHNLIFDVSYSAFLWSRSLLEKQWYQVFNRLYKDDEWLHLQLRRNARKSSTSVCFISCDLSDYDRTTAVDCFLSGMTSWSEPLVKLSVNTATATPIRSCQQLLSHVLTDLLLQPEVVRIVKSASKSKSMQQIDTSFLLANAAVSFEVLLDIVEQALLPADTDSRLQIVITVGFLESIAPEAFNTWLRFLKQQRWSIVVLVCCADLALPQYELCAELSHGLLHCQRKVWPSSQVLFGEVARAVVVDSPVPVIMPASVLTLLDAEYQMCTNCVGTFLRHTESLLQQHFLQRSSLLAMVSQGGWLHKMGLDGSDSAEAPMSRRLHKLFPLLHVDELPEGLQQHLRSDAAAAVPKHAMSQLLLPPMEELQDFLTLSRAVFRVVKTVSDAVLGAQASTSSSSTSSSSSSSAASSGALTSLQLWMALLDRSFGTRKSRVLNDLLTALRSRLLDLTPHTLCATIHTLHTQQIQQHVYGEERQQVWQAMTQNLGDLHRTALHLIQQFQLLSSSSTTSTSSSPLLSLDRQHALSNSTVREIMSQQHNNTTATNSNNGDISRTSIHIDLLLPHLLSQTITDPDTNPNAVLDLDQNPDPEPNPDPDPDTQDTHTHTTQLKQHKQHLHHTQEKQYMQQQYADSQRLFTAAEHQGTVPLRLTLSVALQGLAHDLLRAVDLSLERLLRISCPLGMWEGAIVMSGEDCGRFVCEELAVDMRQRLMHSLLHPEDLGWKPQTQTQTQTQKSQKSQKPRKSQSLGESVVSVPDVSLLRSVLCGAAVRESLQSWFEGFVCAFGQRLRRDQRCYERQVKVRKNKKRKMNDGAAAADDDHDDNHDDGNPDTLNLGNKKRRNNVIISNDHHDHHDQHNDGDNESDLDADSGWGAAQEEQQLQAAYADRALRCRFLHALQELERSAIVSLDRTLAAHIRVTRHVFVGL